MKDGEKESKHTSENEDQHLRFAMYLPPETALSDITFMGTVLGRARAFWYALEWVRMCSDTFG